MPTSFVGLLLALVFVVVPVLLLFTGARLGGFWSRYGTGPTLVVGLDDWVSHALGVWTPLDWLFKASTDSGVNAYHTSIHGTIMENSLSSRRRFLRLGSLGLTTGIAGCSSVTGDCTVFDDSCPVPTVHPDYAQTETDEPTTNVLENPPAILRDSSDEYPFYDLPVHEGLPDPNDLSKLPGNPTDNQVFTIVIEDENTATLIIDEVAIRREIDLTLYVRDASRRYHERILTLDPTDGEEFSTIIHQFDLTSIDIPTSAGGFCELTADVPHPEAPTFLCKRHQFVGIPHKNGVEWMNSEALNYRPPDQYESTPFYAPRGVKVNGNWVTKVEKPGGAIKTIDGPDERTLLMAVHSLRGEVYGVSCHIDHDPVERFKAGTWITEDNKWGYRAYHDISYECHYATEISHLRELARKTADAVTKIRATTPRERFEALGDLVQMIPYSLGHDMDPGATIILYDSTGDCSSKSGLMSAILQNDPWNTMPTFIDCEIDGVGHWTIGLDVNDLGDEFDTANAFTVSPTDEQIADGFPATEYAFFDMTYDSQIGQRTDGVEGPDGGPIIIYDEGDFSHRGGVLSDEPPEY